MNLNLFHLSYGYCFWNASFYLLTNMNQRHSKHLKYFINWRTIYNCWNNIKFTHIWFLFVIKSYSAQYKLLQNINTDFLIIDISCAYPACLFGCRCVCRKLFLQMESFHVCIIWNPCPFLELDHYMIPSISVHFIFGKFEKCEYHL